MAAPQKQYGLIHRKKPTASSSASTGAVFAAAPTSRLAAFASDSDSDSDAAAGPAKVNLALGQLQQRQIRKAQEAAVSADPTIYQYDELYDDIKEQRDVQKVRRPEDKKPKYIERLLVSADARKKEYERRIERQVQKERDAEGEEFADKESFVTASYRAKLEEMKLAEATEKRDEYLEAIGDVTRQRDLGGFYRHLYEQRMGPAAAEGIKADATVDAAQEQDTDASKDDKKDTSNETAGEVSTVRKERTYRKRTASDVVQSDDEKDTADVESSPVKKAHIQSNLDADSDFSIDSSDSEDEAAAKAADHSKEAAADVFAKPYAVVGPNPKPNDACTSDKEGPKEPAAVASVPDVATKDAKSESPPPEVIVKVKVNIWQKRTVGDVLLAAIQRYYERKVARDAQ